MAKTAVEVERLLFELKLAKEGKMSANLVLRKWNNGIGVEIGKTNNIDTALSRMITKKDAYIQYRNAKAKADAAFRLAEKAKQKQIKMDVIE